MLCPSLAGWAVTETDPLTFVIDTSMRLKLWALSICMDSQLEAVALLMEPSLPDGYRVKDVEGRLYLFDPQGIPLHGPTNSSLIEAFAWRHAWRHIERELNEELAALHTGIRPLHSLRRLRQYMRMLDAASQLTDEVEQRPVRRGMVAWGALAASAAAVAAVFLMTPLRTAQISEKTAHRVASIKPATPIFADHPAPPSPAEPGASGSERVPPAMRTLELPRGAVSDARAEPHRPTLAKYAVSFGEFVNRATADSMMHLIRSRGYIVYVAQIEEGFRVVTHPYRTRAQAERLANALQEIGWPVELAIARGI
jgi:cell division septation protein DedD